MEDGRTLHRTVVPLLLLLLHALRCWATAAREVELCTPLLTAPWSVGCWPVALLSRTPTLLLPFSCPPLTVTGRC